MSPEEFFRKGVSQISPGKRIHREGKSIFKQRRNPPAVKSKIIEDNKSTNKERVQNRDEGVKEMKEHHIDVVI